MTVAPRTGTEIDPVAGSLTPVNRPWLAISRRQQTRTLAALFLVGVFNYADRTVISVLLEPIKADFGVSDAALGLLTGFAFALLYATLGLPVARLTDRGNRPVIIVWMLALWSAMSLLSGLATSYLVLALARVGVGAGEAGAVPAAQSLIGDTFSPEERPRAIAIYMMSSTIGVLVATLCGPWLAGLYGWRTAFVAIALPGLVLAAVIRPFLVEPRAVTPAASKREPAWPAVRALLAKRTYRITVAAMTLYFFVAFGAFLFFPSFLIRSHNLSLSAAGAMFGISNAVGGLIGTYLFGVLTSRLVRRDEAWLLRLPALCLVGTWTSVVGFLLGSGSMMLWTMLLLAGALTGGALPAMFSALHVICGSDRRATAVALMFLFANLIGLGLGPLVTGAASDALALAYGPAEGLRLALLAVTAILLPCALLLWNALGNLAQDREL